jgi:hypothetical protein
VNQAIRHLTGFKIQGLASSGKSFIPGGEKMLAVKTVDLLFFHMKELGLEWGEYTKKGSSMSRETTKYARLTNRSIYPEQPFSHNGRDGLSEKRSTGTLTTCG